MEEAVSRPADSEPPRPFATTSGFPLAPDNPVVSVHVLGILPHLDRPFEYAVPATLAQVQPGMRVRVRFAGKEREGLVRARYATPHTSRALAPLVKVVSDDQVIAESMFRVCEDIATRYAGTVADVLRLAVPPRSAAAEKQVHATRESHTGDTTTGPNPPKRAQAAENLEDAGSPAFFTEKFTGLAAFLTHAADPDTVVPRASLVLDPVDSWIDLALETTQALPTDAGVLILASDQRDVDRAAQHFRERGLEPVILTSAAGPHKRYSSFLSVLYGTSRIVIGTRSAAFAPVHNLRLILMFDPDDDLFEDPRAPYPHARTVALSRSYSERIPLLYVMRTPSAALRLLETKGVLAALTPVPASHEVTRPRVELMDEYLREREGPSGYSRLPHHAYARIREGLERGPVLVSVPRSGYVQSLCCTFCGTRATCLTCHASLGVPGRGSGVLVCRVCGRSHGAYRCQECDRTDFRPLIVGSGRIADDLSRSFPKTTLHVSGGAQGVVPDEDVRSGEIVVATPGAEPLPDGGYAASLIVDPELALGRAVYDADTEAVRRFSHVIAATRVFAEGGHVLVVGRAPHRALRALVLPRSTAFIDSVVRERDELGLPPLRKVVEAQGSTAALHHFLAAVDLPATASVFGPVECGAADGDRQSRAILRAPLEDAAALVVAARAAAHMHSAKKIPGSLRIQVDPPHVF